MKGKTKSQFVVGVVLLAIIIFGGIFWLRSLKHNSENRQAIVPAKIVSANLAAENQVLPEKTEVAAALVTIEDCKHHYYEGEASLKGWLLSSDQNNGSDVLVQLKDGEAQKLPIKDSQSVENFTVKLVDPTDGIKKQLSGSTKEKPATIVVHGYAEICEQSPLVSLQQATIAFKKKS